MTRTDTPVATALWVVAILVLFLIVALLSGCEMDDPPSTRPGMVCGTRKDGANLCIENATLYVCIKGQCAPITALVLEATK